MSEIKLITITRAEGRIEECGIEHFATSWKEADNILFEMSKTAPDDFGYDKTDFHILFEDGLEYNGRYDLVHHSVESPNLHSHIKSFVLFHTGEHKPSHMTEQTYNKYIETYISESERQDYKDFDNKYL